MSGTVLVARQGDIATLVLDNPERMNALSRPMWERLGQVTDELSADDSVRCVVLRGAGSRAFAAGADIAEFEHERANSKQAKRYGRSVERTLRSLSLCRHPVIAMIHGACVGGGLEIAAQCDLRVCGQSARFGVPVKSLGLVMAFAELKGLVDLCGKAVALEIALEGRVFDAREAKEKGLVNRVVPDDKVEEEAYASAQRIAEGAPLVARWHKKFANRLMQPQPLSQAEYDESYACFDTEDYRIGFKAFLAKQKPQFKGR
ncbi:MAG: enoyl-CoA hydratase/isomerase family protein [Betaproteobacteria bacterium]|nr:enoyl-CoA hydratase/isomerase family protein [Betaproteobacteria bacterium]